jgi:hypothetical protein
MKHIASIALAAGALFTASATARGESYCVACYGPDAIYRCVIADAPAGTAPDPRNQVQCIKQLAKSGSHARCSVERFSTAGCNGPERVIQPAMEAIPLAPLPTQPEGATGNPVLHEATEQPAAAAPKKPPETVEELAKSTVESTKKGIDNIGSSVKTTTEKAGEQLGGVGNAIGSAAKKSWDCVTSLFSDC